MTLRELEPWIRMGCALGIFSAMTLWELGAGFRPLRVGRGRRWLANLGLLAADALAVRLMAPAGLVGLAMVAEEQRWGVLQRMEVPMVAAGAAAVVVLDLVVYLQHVLFHQIPALWRFHRVHHADHDFDVTTGVRFHPGEIVISFGLKAGVVFALGAPPVAVLIFEVLLNGTSMFNHGNVTLSRPLDRVLRWIVVTPDMHRVHHSTERAEHDRNYGFNFPWWDRLLGTYLAEPAAGREGMAVGLEAFPEVRLQSLPWLLRLPFASRRSLSER